MSAAVLEGRARKRETAGPLSLPMAIGLVLVGLFAFAALVLLMSYSDELRPDEPVIATANDPSAVGFKGLQVLLDELGHEVRVDPYPARGEWNGRDFRLYFPTTAFSDARRERLETYAPGLVVLPKWAAGPVAEGESDVVRRSDPGLNRGSGRILSTLAESHVLYVHQGVQIETRVPGSDAPVVISYPQWIEHAPETENEAETEAPEAVEDETDADDPEDEAEKTQFEKDLEELMRELERDRSMELVDRRPPGTFESVLHDMPDLNLLLLSDPDLLNNHGIATEDRARAALALLADAARYYNIEDPVFVFDDNLRRADTSQNLVKLLTRPPFLAATLCLLAAGALIGWQGFNRFGDAVRDGEDGPDTARSGPRALAETAAQFIEGAGRVDRLAPNYADVVRRQAVERLGLSVWDHERADAALRSRETLREIQPTLAAIRGNPTLTPMARAAALQQWKEEITR